MESAVVQLDAAQMEEILTALQSLLDEYQTLYNFLWACFSGLIVAVLLAGFAIFGFKVVTEVWKR